MKPKVGGKKGFTIFFQGYMLFSVGQSSLNAQGSMNTKQTL